MALPTHYLRIGSVERELDPASIDPTALRRDVEPWLAAVLQSEHLAVLFGSGLSLAVASLAKAASAGMGVVSFGAPHEASVNKAAELQATRIGRGSPNIEDQLRSALQLVDGLALLGETEDAAIWRSAISQALTAFMNGILDMEGGISAKIEARTAEGLLAIQTLVTVLLTFASRAASRDRLNVFTTNYDRVLEYGFDAAGIRALDRFIGNLSPVFRASRLELDMHYNPPGMRGEPRYLEGVVRFAKLHGSLDWRYREGEIRRIALPFGTREAGAPDDGYSSMMIYPNAAKDVETVLYPFAELFRDFAAAICRPNSALVTYGYGFGDDHINRVLADMLIIPSTHLVIISHSDAGGRIDSFLSRAGHPQQISILLGDHLGDLGNLSTFYLPRPAVDALMTRKAEILGRRADDGVSPPQAKGHDA